ncbi:hypothetical protein [Sulfurivermis fontis]|uniref:hypothetical protein n=1 Tax=Sulfurivermis fontis TaxID=1972068 RepID=UPI000FD7DA3F|nr:hypothetical protein [Sulfurivermis fontis]
MSMQARPFPWRVFLRRRFPVHAEGWVYAQVPLWWTALLFDPAAGLAVDAFYALACLFVAAGVAGALVLLAALLRFPWWLLMPPCLASMGAEALWRKLVARPWTRHPMRKRWYLSNAVALWQWWDIKAQRRLRQLFRRRPAWSLQPSATPLSERQREVRIQPATVVRFPDPPGSGLLDYAFTVLAGHVMFWYVVSFVGTWIYFAWDEQTDWLLAFFIALVLFVAGTVFMLLPIVLGGVALISALLVGSMLPPVERARTVRALQPPAPPPAQQLKAIERLTNWLLPLALGLLIGSAWGGGEGNH